MGGCRIMCRLLQHATSHNSVVALIDEVLDEAVFLCQHSFGHHVMETILEHCPPEQQKHVVDSIRRILPESVNNRNASFVIEKALSDCVDKDIRKAIAQELLYNSRNIDALANSLPGYSIIQELL